MSTIKIKQIRSKIRRPKDQKKTLEALGLRKIGHIVEHKKTPSIAVSYTHLTLPTKA